MNREIGAPSSTSARAQTSPRDGPGGAGGPRFGSWKAPTPYFARIGTMNRDGAIVGQPSRLSSRASRPRRILGRDAPAAGGTPVLSGGPWKSRRKKLLSESQSNESMTHTKETI